NQTFLAIPADKQRRGLQFHHLFQLRWEDRIFVSNISRKATPLFLIASKMSRSRTDSRSFIHNPGAPTMAATKILRLRYDRPTAPSLKARRACFPACLAKTRRHTTPEEARSASHLEAGRDKCQSHRTLPLCG